MCFNCIYRLIIFVSQFVKIRRCDYTDYTLVLLLRNMVSTIQFSPDLLRVGVINDKASLFQTLVPTKLLFQDVPRAGVTNDKPPMHQNLVPPMNQNLVPTELLFQGVPRAGVTSDKNPLHQKPGSDKTLIPRRA